MVFLTLQWNARSLIANGQEFKRYIHNLNKKPEVLCIQETWVKPNLDFVLKGYNGIRCDREKGRGGGCMTFIKLGILYRCINSKEHECVITEIFNGVNGHFTVINYYNPCKVLNSETLKSIVKKSHREIWCGDLLTIVYGVVNRQI